VEQNKEDKNKPLLLSSLWSQMIEKMSQTELVRVSFIYQL